MNVTFNKTSELTGIISVNLTAADYVPAYNKTLKDLAKKVNIPGFRAGHAPKGMVEKMYGQQTLLDEVNKLASKGLFDHIEENKLNTLGQPILTEDTKIDELSINADYTFNFEIGLAPEFELNISAKDTFTKYEVNITDEMLNEEVSRMQKRFGNLVDAEKVSDNDVIYFNMTELSDGNELEGGATASSVPVSMNTIKNTDIKNSLLGAAKGAEFTFNIFALFNNDESEISHALGVQKAGVADLGPDFKCAIQEIKNTQPAEINQDLFDKVYGKDVISSEEELRTKIKEELSGYFNGQAMHLVEHELFDQLVAKHNITLPDEFLKRWLINSYPDKFNDSNINEGYIPEANYLKNHLLEEKILKANNITIGDDEIKQAAYNYTRSMFGAYGGGAGLTDELLESIVEPQMKKDDFRSRMINIAVRNRVNDFIKNTVTLEPKLVSEAEFIEIVNNHNNKHHAHSHEAAAE